MSNKDGCH